MKNETHFFETKAKAALNNSSKTAFVYGLTKIDLFNFGYDWWNDRFQTRFEGNVISPTVFGREVVGLVVLRSIRIIVSIIS